MEERQVKLIFLKGVREDNATVFLLPNNEIKRLLISNDLAGRTVALYYNGNKMLETTYEQMKMVKELATEPKAKKEELFTDLILIGKGKNNDTIRFINDLRGEVRILVSGEVGIKIAIAI